MTAKGFTLIELLVVVAIVALLASIAAPLAELSWQRGKEQDLRYALRQIREAIDAYKRASEDGKIERKADASGYPPTLSALVEACRQDGSGEVEDLLLRRSPRDPMTEHWGLQPCQPGERPEAGKDVYDVYSRSDDGPEQGALPRM
jgi:general secretion pathway protein G